MVVKVSGRDLIELFELFIKSTKVMFNFKVSNSKLSVQVLEDYTACTEIECTIVEYSGSSEVSLWITSAIFTISKDFDVEIKIGDATSTFSQGFNECIFKNEWEARREFPDYSNVVLTNAFANRLKYIMHSITTCNPLAKELSIPYPDPMFSHGHIYMDYGQTFFIESIDYPEFCITSNDMKDVVYKLEEDAQMCYMHEYNVLLFISGKYEFWVPVNNYNLQGSTIANMDKLLSNSNLITTVTFKEHLTPMQVVAQAYQKKRVELSISDGVFRVAAISPDNRTVIGNLIGMPKISISITPNQLSVIAKIFKEDDDIEVRRGVNCLILKKQEKNLLLAGLLY